jgi:predicted nucleotidyltransferase
MRSNSHPLYLMIPTFLVISEIKESFRRHLTCRKATIVATVADRDGQRWCCASAAPTQGGLRCRRTKRVPGSGHGPQNRQTPGRPPYTCRMRLSPYQRDVIRSATAEVAGPAARVLLFGSRTRPELRGGDIDLLVELDHISPDRLALACRIGSRIEMRLGLQKLDILVADPVTPPSPILEAARREGVVL